jgi:TusE/DsrC/DsvC family sulfur relay protein
MTTVHTPRAVQVEGRAVPTDSEGYLQHLGDWSEAFARALAREEGLVLTPAHWEVIRFLREYYQEHGGFGVRPGMFSIKTCWRSTVRCVDQPRSCTRQT